MLNSIFLSAILFFRGFKASMKIMNINNNPNQKNYKRQLSFKAKVTEFNPLAQKTLLNLDKRFKGVFDGTSKEIKEIKFDGKPVNVRIWGWDNSDKISIMARLNKKSRFFGATDFLPARAEGSKIDNFSNFIMSIKNAVGDIGKHHAYKEAQLNSAIRKVNIKNTDKSIIKFDCKEAKEEISELGNEFAHALKKHAEEIQQIDVDGKALKILIGSYGKENTVTINTTFREKDSSTEHLWANVLFSTKKSAEENADIEDFIKSVKKATNLLKAKQKRRSSKVSNN